jgi:Tol biopolymer transport system component
MRNRRTLLLVAVVAVLVAAGCDAVRVSVSSAGSQGNGASFGVTLSRDANLVAFVSDASNLVSGDTNAVSDVFVRDARTNVTSLVSVATGGQPANGQSLHAAMSADGRYVAFTSYATNLVPGAPAVGVYLRDLQAGTTTLVSKKADGAVIPLNQPGRIAISSTGRFVAFLGDFKVYRYDRSAGHAALVLDALREPTSLSSNGRYLATDTIPLIGVRSIVSAVFDLTTAQVVFSGPEPENSFGIRMTPDAKYVVYAYSQDCFPSQFPTCTAGPSGARLHNLVTGEDHAVVTNLGQDADVDAVSVSDNAKRLAVAARGQVYLYDRPTGTFVLVTSATNKVDTGDASTNAAVISADGGIVGFSSLATNLVVNDTNGVEDVFTRRP